MTQGFHGESPADVVRAAGRVTGPGWRWLAGLWMLLLAAACTARPQPPVASAASCPGPALRIEPLGPGLWWVPAALGDSQADNRGQVSNLVLVRQGRGAAARLWALGSGPTPAFGRALACRVRQQLGGRVTDVVSPWARPELVLGVQGLQDGGPLRHWAHAAVAEAMAAQCPYCVDRLRQRLAAAAADLGDDPIALPERLLHGEQGRLGPFRWWRLPRADGRWVTVWRLQDRPRDRPLWVAHGLLQGDGPPDGRDADLVLLQRSSQRLAVLSRADGAAARFIGEQGPVLDAGAPDRHAGYWGRLVAEARAAVARGDDESAPPHTWPGLAEAWAGHPWQALNWQRAWRQVEPAVLAAPPR